MALLRLDRAAFLQPHVLPICLPSPTSTEGVLSLSNNKCDLCSIQNSHNLYTLSLLARIQKVETKVKFINGEIFLRQFLGVFLAVQDSSISDIVCRSVGPLEPTNNDYYDYNDYRDSDLDLD